jgi:MFS family permease
MVCIAEFFSLVGAATFPALLPQFMKEWQLSNTDAGLLNGVYYAGYLVTVPILVTMTDHWPTRKIYFFSLSLTALSSLGFVYGVDGFWSAIIYRTLGGIGLAGSYMPGLKLLTDHLDHLSPTSDNNRGVAFYTSSFGIGTAFSFFLAGEITIHWDWKMAFLVSAIGPIIAVAITQFFLPPKDPLPHKAPSTHPLDFTPILKNKPSMAYVLAYTVHNFELFAYRSWLVTFLTYSALTAPSQNLFFSVTVWAAIANLAGLPASVLGNELSRCIGRHKAITIIMLVSAAMAFMIGFSAELPFIIVAVLAVIYGVAITGESSAITAGLLVTAPAGYRGAAMAVHSCIGFMGSFAGPLAFGLTLDLSSPSGVGGITTQSWGFAFAMTGAVVALGPFFIMLLGKKSRD